MPPAITPSFDVPHEALLQTASKSAHSQAQRRGQGDFRSTDYVLQLTRGDRHRNSALNWHLIPYLAAVMLIDPSHRAPVVCGYEAGAETWEESSFLS